MTATSHSVNPCTYLCIQDNTKMSTPIRVRALLSALNSVEKSALCKLLPPKVKTAPEEPEGTRYPAALLAALTKGEQYSLAGNITEELLYFPVEHITTDLLKKTVAKWCPVAPIDKILVSKTTEPYLQHVRATRIKMRAVATLPFSYHAEVGTGGPVVGHPDMRTATEIFEIKMTGKLKENWVDFLLQVFCYGALDEAATHVYLVLPLQEIVWGYDLRTWTKRAEFRAALHTAAAKKDQTAGSNQQAMLLIQLYNIGSHMSKLKSLVDTVVSLPPGRPSQIFLAGPQSSRLQIADAELAAARAAVQATGTRIFIHSPYIINLCTPAGRDDDYHTRLLIKNLEYGVAMGSRGVVVHVGKSTTQDMAVAMANMRSNIMTALAAATPECPLLLETPAGQGSEVLKTWAEFAAFVAEINDSRLRVCIDTCHVFACGSDPLKYLQDFLAAHPAMTRLIHFNDSATPCGSCLDRHAFCGQGHIGIDTMTAIATTAATAGLPMVIE
jgi:deoxyribonuclease-4